MRFVLFSILLLAIQPSAAQHWIQIHDVGGTNHVRCIVPDPVHERVYFGTYGGLRIYSIPDMEWIIHDNSGGGGRAHSIAGHPNHPLRLLEGYGGDFFNGWIDLSEDLGKTWKTVYSHPFSSVDDIARDPGMPDRFFATVSEDVQRSVDGGWNWDPVLMNGPGWARSVDVGPDGAVYVGFSNGVLRSDDSGESWVSATGDMPILWEVTQLVTDPTAPGHVYAGQGGNLGPNDESLGIYESFDSGTHWLKILDGNVRQLSIHPDSPEVLAAVIVTSEVRWAASIQLSMNGGDSWINIVGDLPEFGGHERCAISSTDQKIYLAYNQVWVTDLTLTQVPPTLPAVHALHAFPNPFNPRTEIRFELPEAAPVSLRVYSPTGQLLRELLTDAPCAAGERTIVWDGNGEAGRSLSSGVYLIEVETGSYRASRKLVLLK